jgi:hypothetical protein
VRRPPSKGITPRIAVALLRLGDSSSQVDRPPGGPGPRSCVGTRLATTIGAPLFVSRGEALRYVRRFGSAASDCRNRTNPSAGLHRRTALPSTTSASGRRRSSRFISPQLRRLGLSSKRHGRGPGCSPVVAHARDRARAYRASVSALIDRCCFDRRSGVVDPAAPARIAARAGSDSRLQPVKHEPLESRATLSLAFLSGSLITDVATCRDCSVKPIQRSWSRSGWRLPLSGPFGSTVHGPSSGLWTKAVQWPGRRTLTWAKKMSVGPAMAFGFAIGKAAANPCGRPVRPK